LRKSTVRPGLAEALAAHLGYTTTPEQADARFGSARQAIAADQSRWNGVPSKYYEGLSARQQQRLAADPDLLLYSGLLQTGRKTGKAWQVPHKLMQALELRHSGDLAAHIREAAAEPAAPSQRGRKYDNELARQLDEVGQVSGKHNMAARQWQEAARLLGQYGSFADFLRAQPDFATANHQLSQMTGATDQKLSPLLLDMARRHGGLPTEHLGGETVGVHDVQKRRIAAHMMTADPAQQAFLKDANNPKNIPFLDAFDRALTGDPQQTGLDPNRAHATLWDTAMTHCTPKNPNCGACIFKDACNTYAAKHGLPERPGLPSAALPAYDAQKRTTTASGEPLDLNRTNRTLLAQTKKHVLPVIS
jgi:hypothetical protein